MAMPHPDFENARQYALHRLETELPQELTYHALPHTRDDVVPAVERLAAMEGVKGEPLILLRTAALFHDLGFIEQYNSNEHIAVRMAHEALPVFGYSPSQVEVISNIILTTRIPQTPHTPLEEIMADGDLDSLGREDFWELSSVLRSEQALFGKPVSDLEWDRIQLDFLQAHHYFTRSAINLRQECKEQHISELVRLLENGSPG